jgi:single-strand DNA-binding protein
MANFNKVILIGRLTGDPESRTFSNGGKVAKFRFAVSNRKKNSQSGQWEDEPMFIDCEAFNRGESGTLANTIETYCKKGSLICIEGKLHLDQWDDKTTGAKRSKHKIVVDSMQLLERKGEDGQGGGGRMSAGSGDRAPAKAAAGGDEYDDRPAGGNGDEIPF